MSSGITPQEPDFAENELIYEDLDLEEVQTGLYGTATGKVCVYVTCVSRVSSVSSLMLYTSVAVGTGSVHPPVMEEEINSIPISPSSSQGPLSPKTPTTMKSTSQVRMECADRDHQIGESP